MREILGQDVKQALKTDKFLDTRDRLPETVASDYPSMITDKEPLAPISPKYFGKPVAIIGAGAAGLCAGYELMRMGLYPIYFESQTFGDGTARPGGRAYSYDFADALQLTKKSVGELGCMRFPKSHTTLHAYVDNIFKGEYKYATELETQWPPFIDPLLYDNEGDIPQSNWKVMYDTMFMAQGIRKRAPYRVNAGSTFGDMDSAIQDVATAFGELIFDDNNGILTPIVKAYAAGDINQISFLWDKLNDTYQEKSIFEVLRDQGWDKKIVGTNNASRLELFGELGIGSGGFDAFWGTTFMEVLRIKLHEDESNQRAFVGGSSYMLKPFLTHVTEVRGSPPKSLKRLTDNKVIISPVVRIDEKDGGGVVISCEDGNTYSFPIVIMTPSPTAISSSIMVQESLLSPDLWKGIRRMPLTDSGKIFLAFPTPFWKGTSRRFPGHDAIVTTITDYNLRQVYTFDNYHWGSSSPAGVLMISYTWGDWAHKFGSFPEKQQVESAIRMLKEIYKEEWLPSWDTYFSKALETKAYKAITWSHERGFAGGYRMADLNRYEEQQHMWIRSAFPYSDNAAVLTAGEAVAWLGLSGWVEGALHTGINSALGVGAWLSFHGDRFSNWENMVKPAGIVGTSFTPPSDPGTISFNPRK